MPFTIDEFRYKREQIDPISYLERSYYEHWLIVLERQLLDRIRIDRSHIVGSIDPVNPVYTYTVEQIHVVDGIADGDSQQPRSALEARLVTREEIAARETELSREDA